MALCIIKIEIISIILLGYTVVFLNFLKTFTTNILGMR